MALFFFDSVNILVKSDHGDPGPNHFSLTRSIFAPPLSYTDR